MVSLATPYFTLAAGQYFIFVEDEYFIYILTVSALSVL